MSYTPCRYARRWPDLWVLLPDDEARARVSDNLAAGRLDGYEPTREDVERLVDTARGAVSTDDAVARIVAEALAKEWDIANELSLYQDEPGALRPFTALVPVLDEMTVTRPVVDAGGNGVGAGPRRCGPAGGPVAERPDPLPLRPCPRCRTDLRPRPRRGPRAVAVLIPPGRCRSPGGRW